MLRHDRTTRILLAVIAFLLGANLWRVYQDRTAQAEASRISGGQLQQQIDLLAS